MAKETAKMVGIYPVYLSTEEHSKLQKIQAFLHFTTGKTYTKPIACEVLIREGIKVIEGKMEKYTQK